MDLPLKFKPVTLYYSFIALHFSRSISTDVHDVYITYNHTRSENSVKNKLGYELMGLNNSTKSTILVTF